MNAPRTVVEAFTAGFALFPCKADKTPACDRGFKDAATHPDAFQALCRGRRPALVGIATGPASNVAVLDLDAKHAPARLWWAENRPRLDRTMTLRTRSGGLHLYYLDAPGLRCSVGTATAGIAEGVDVRAQGGYVIAWSLAGFPVLDDAPLAPWPGWLGDLLIRPVRQAQPEPLIFPDRNSIKGLIRLVATATEPGRNSKLFWSAIRICAAVQHGVLSQTEAEACLFEAARHCGLPPIAAGKTIRSGFVHGGLE